MNLDFDNHNLNCILQENITGSNMKVRFNTLSKSYITQKNNLSMKYYSLELYILFISRHLTSLFL